MSSVLAKDGKQLPNVWPLLSQIDVGYVSRRKTKTIFVVLILSVDKKNTNERRIFRCCAMFVGVICEVKQGRPAMMKKK